MGQFHKVSLDSLGLLDEGKGAAAFQALLDRAADDCDDRPGEPKPRKVTLEIEMVPVLEADLQCTEVKAVVKAKLTVPQFSTKEYSFALRKTNKGSILVFSEDSPSNVNQGTLGLGDDDA
jgi:hypothetical protein